MLTGKLSSLTNPVSLSTTLEYYKQTSTIKIFTLTQRSGTESISSLLVVQENCTLASESLGAVLTSFLDGSLK